MKRGFCLVSRDNRRTHRPLGLTSALWHNGKDKQEVLCIQRQSQHKPAELTTGASIHEYDWAKHLKEVLLTPPRSVFASPVMQSCSYNAASWRHNCLILMELEAWESDAAAELMTYSSDPPATWRRNPHHHRRPHCLRGISGGAKTHPEASSDLHQEHRSTESVPADR